jgi:hypothetical protein
MNLIQLDYSNLTDFLTLLKKTSDAHDSSLTLLVKTSAGLDGSLLDLQLQQQQQATASSLQDKEIRNLHELADSFKAGLDEMHSTADKVNAWNERFRLIEERNYQIYKDLNDVSVNLQRQIDSLRDNVESSAADVLERFQAEILKRHGEGERSLASHCKVLEQELEILKLEQKVGVERLQRELSEQLTGVYDSIGMSAPSPRVVQSFPLEHSSAADKGKTSLWNTLAGKVAKLEDKLLISPKQIVLGALREPEEMEDALLEINHRFNYIANEVDSLKSLINVVQTAPTSVKTSPVKESYVSLVDKVNALSSLREAAPALLKLEAKVAGLTEVLSSFSQATKEPESALPYQLRQKSSRSNSISTTPVPEGGMFSENLSALPSLHEKQLPIEADEHQGLRPTHDPRMDEVCETVNRMLHCLPQMVNITEFEQISVIVKRLLKERQREAGITREAELAAKLDEIEQRLNRTWKQNIDLSSLIQQIAGQLERTSQELIEQQDSKIGDVTYQVNTTQSELKKHVDSIVENISQMASEFEAKEPRNSEVVLMRQILSVKQGLEQTEEKIERLEKLIGNQAGLLNVSDDDLAEINVESMSSMQKFQAVLNHHEKSIRMLCSRINIGPGFEESKSKKLEANGVLGHLEKLRAEMHELQVKYDANKSLSGKEMQKLNEIYSLLETKSDRQELGRKVDKTELKRLERLLKKQIDKVNDALKKAEELPQQTREDAFFLKKRLDLDCASCGQGLPNHHDHLQQFTPKERFPIRSALFKSGFSRFLSSLVPDESGGLTLPRSISQGLFTTTSADLRSQGSSPMPTKMSSAMPSQMTKRRLPKIGPKGS